MQILNPVRSAGVWCVCHYKKCKWCLIGRATRDIVEEVIEVDELDEGSISTAAGNEMNSRAELCYTWA